MRKYVSIILVILAVTVGVFTFFFSSSKNQIGDYILEGDYFNTAYDAFIKSGGCSEYEFSKELATVKVTNNFAIWITNTKTNEFMLVKMSLKNGQYCSLDDFIIIKTTDYSISQLEREFSLGEEKSLLFTICPSSDFKEEESIKTASFDFKNKSFVFAYKVVDKT